MTDEPITEDDSMSTGAGFNKKIDGKYLVITLLLKIQQIVTAPELNKRAYKESVDYLGRVMRQADDQAYKKYEKALKGLEATKKASLDKLESEKSSEAAKQRETGMIDQIERETFYARKVDTIQKKFIDDKLESLVELLDIKNLLFESDVVERVGAPKKKVGDDFELPDAEKVEL
jgi:hypothetical protein